jgi:hypothetical protein
VPQRRRSQKCTRINSLRPRHSKTLLQVLYSQAAAEHHVLERSLLNLERLQFFLQFVVFCLVCLVAFLDLPHQAL